MRQSGAYRRTLALRDRASILYGADALAADRSDAGYTPRHTWTLADVIRAARSAELATDRDASDNPDDATARVARRIVR